MYCIHYNSKRNYQTQQHNKPESHKCYTAVQHKSVAYYVQLGKRATNDVNTNETRCKKKMTGLVPRLLELVKCNSLSWLNFTFRKIREATKETLQLPMFFFFFNATPLQVSLISNISCTLIQLIWCSQHSAAKSQAQVQSCLAVVRGGSGFFHIKGIWQPVYNSRHLVAPKRGGHPHTH